MLPPTSSFTRAVPPLHDFADVNQLSRGDKQLLKKYKNFLGPYLEEIKGTKTAVGCQMVIRPNQINNLHLYASSFISNNGFFFMCGMIQKLKKYRGNLLISWPEY